MCSLRGVLWMGGGGGGRRWGDGDAPNSSCVEGRVRALLSVSVLVYVRVLRMTSRFRGWRGHFGSRLASSLLSRPFNVATIKHRLPTTSDTLHICVASPRSAHTKARALPARIRIRARHAIRSFGLSLCSNPACMQPSKVCLAFCLPASLLFLQMQMPIVATRSSETFV
ncbi:hypothetical protein FIBSPDRAFT_483013 [Athelia psychrophila]|uniref:Uncharacterized protein n=1 Tax=Athelia psychrophila TaxID=1759441 RepID=A0A166L103_9AGAM|nr:hypothetical protein FIBSPDRAFT_483013 [Fibularhizoctonia sp. CBS 109695]